MTTYRRLWYQEFVRHALHGSLVKVAIDLSSSFVMIFEQLIKKTLVQNEEMHLKMQIDQPMIGMA